MNQLDDMLARLQAAPLPARLAAIDTSVLSHLAERQRNALPLSGGMVGMAFVAALGMGLAGAVIPGPTAEVAPSALPFGVPGSLAPSTLLDGSK